MKLLVSPLSPYGRKVRIVLAEKRIECELELVDVTPADSPLNAHNPLGKIPILLLDDGSALYDSRVIVEFLDAVSPIGRLIPKGNRERVAVLRWEALADGVLDAGVLLRQETLRPKKEQSAAWIERQRGKLERGVAEMAHDLGERDWCHSERITLADISLASCLGWLAFRLPELDWRGMYA
ncbi:MAG: glutathione S-transferase family protein, partial [Burkholderiales bacterium]